MQRSARDLMCEGVAAQTTTYVVDDDAADFGIALGIALGLARGIVFCVSGLSRTSLLCNIRCVRRCRCCLGLKDLLLFRRGLQECVSRCLHCRHRRRRLFQVLRRASHFHDDNIERADGGAGCSRFLGCPS